ncbi:uncharacterized protein LOC143145014 [Ptiloglossa arizonensis]|uniref:uncharacterized protein LOC143145014 n=1 Tax=Ptiloglossa arizonensis TaxID=3350558 RepID=UPI003FA0ADFD
MWPLLSRIQFFGINIVRFPIVVAIGFLGYHIEGLLSNRYTPAAAPIKQQREERLLGNIDTMPGKEGHHPLEVNLPPSLST